MLRFVFFFPSFSPSALMKHQASSPKPPLAHVSPNTPKSRPKRARTPIRLEAKTKTPTATKQTRERHSEYLGMHKCSETSAVYLDSRLLIICEGLLRE